VIVTPLRDDGEVTTTWTVLADFFLPRC